MNPKSQATIKRHYEKWRSEQGIPARCDNEKCQFFEGNLVWNDSELPLILDHDNGNSKDNQPRNLRYLCPNCDAQLPTRGGGNVGRVRNESEVGYQIRNKDGTGETQIFQKKTIPLNLKTHRAKVSGNDSKVNHN